MVLTDKDITGLRAESLLSIEPFAPESLTPVGYDLRVGRQCYVFNSLRVQEGLEVGSRITVPPRTTALVWTLEDVRMPVNGWYSGIVQSKVSTVSQGLSPVSTTVDWDWGGSLVIATANLTNGPITLRVGDPFCTLMILKNQSSTTTPSGHDTNRDDILIREMKKWQSRLRLRRAVWHALPIAIAVGGATAGWALFGPSEGFSAVAASAACVAVIVHTIISPR